MHISPSQAKTAELCRRKWYLEKVEKIPQPQGRSTSLGTAVHSVAEAFLRGETYDETTEAARVFASAIPIASVIRPRVIAIERSISIVLPRSGIELQGRIDVVAGTPSRPAIIDWKTTSGPRYARTAEELATDVQLCAYAAAVSAACHDVDVSHVYMQTKGKPKAWRVDAVATVSAQLETLDRLDTLACDLVELRTQPREAAPQNLESCSAFGGCPYRYICHPDRHTKEIDMSSMLDRIRARQAALAQSTAPTPTPAAPPEPPPPPPPVEEPAAILPPDAPTGPTVAPVEKKKPGRPRKTPAPLLDGIPAAPPPPVEAPAAVDTAAPIVGPVDLEPPVAPDAAEFPPKPTPTADLGPGLVILIDCAPTAGLGNAQSLEPYASTIAGEVAAAAEKADWRLIPYGQGAGLIAASVRAMPPAPGIYLASSRSPTVAAVLDALLPLASIVVRGL